MFTLEILNNHSKDLFVVGEFIKDFLIDSLKSGEAGYFPVMSEEDENNMNQFVKLNFLSDLRDRSILMIAAEAGNLKAVNFLIKGHSNVHYSVNDELPIDFAYKNNHFDICLKLLEENSPFPKNFDINFDNDELKMFVDVMTLMHDSIKNGDKEKVLEIIELKLHLRYFYDLENTSARAQATKIVNEEIYEIILLKNFLYASESEQNLSVSLLTEEDKEKLRDINFRNARSFSENHIMALMTISTLGHGAQNPHEKFNYVHKALNVLNNIPNYKKVLELSAVAKNLQLIFDFENEILQYLYPTAGPYVDGSFYQNSGQIAIAAKKLLNPETEHIVYGALAHELCHFALHLLHKNMAKPYAKDDHNAEIEFEKILIFCREKKETEKIINWVFGYSESLQHAELAVRAFHIMGHYHNNSEKVEELREEFKPLFDNFEEIILPQIEKKIPELKEKEEKEIQGKFLKQKQKISLLRKIVTGLLILAPILILTAILIVYSPTYKWNKLNHEQQDKIKNLTVKYHGVDLKFSEIFANDSLTYDLLSSEQIKSGLEGESEILTEAIRTTFDKFVYFNWTNMTENLKLKFLTLDVDFQGEFVVLCEIISSEINCDELNLTHKVDFQVLSNLTPIEIRNNFNGQKLKLSSSTEIKTKFFVDRFYIKEEIVKGFYENDEINYKNLNVINSSKILSDVETSRIFLLSDYGGEGKSTSFKNFAIKLKRKFPKKWIQFVDLKNYFDEFKTANLTEIKSVEKSLNFLTENIFNLTQIEKKIFINLYKSDNLIFLWDGVDEISPVCFNFTKLLFKNIQKFTKNIQFISTRPQYSPELSQELKVNALKIIPLGKFERIQFLIKFIVSESFKLDAEKIWSEIILNFDEKTDISFLEICKNCGEEIEKYANEKNLTTFELLKIVEKKTRSEKFELAKVLSKSKNYLGLEVFDKFKFLSHNISKTLKNFNLNTTTIEKITSAITKGQKILNTIEVSKKGSLLVANPLLIQMIAEMVIFEDFKVEKNLNFFKIVDIFINKKLSIQYKKGQNAENEIIKILKDAQRNLMKVHQAFAINAIFTYFVNVFFPNYTISNFEITSEVSKWKSEEISRYGILFVDTNSRFRFAHQTFAEFLVAKFLIDNLNLITVKNFNVDSELKISLFNAVLFDVDFKSIKNILISYVESEENLSGFFDIIETNYQLQNITSTENIINTFTSLSFAVFLKNNFNIAMKKFNANFKSIFYDISEFLDKFNDFKELFGSEKFNEILTMDDVTGATILLNFANDAKDSEFKRFLDKLNSTLKKSQLKENILKADELFRTPFMIASASSGEKSLKTFWEYICENLNETEIKNYLKVETVNLKNALQYSTANNDSNSFKFVSGIYNEFFNDDEIRKLLLKGQNESFPFFHIAIITSSKESATELSNYLLDLYKNHKFDLRKLLSRRNKFGESIFSHYINTPEVAEKYEIYVDLLRRSFEENQKTEFKNHLTDLKIISSGNENMQEIACKNSKTYLQKALNELLMKTKKYEQN